MSEKYVYSFKEGDGDNKQLLGGKGANLCEMTQMGLNVPPGFVISTTACLSYLDKKALPAGLMDEVKRQIQVLEKSTGKEFGNPENPLLVSVRSGSAMSMPGMMDTILNLGLNSQTLQGLIKQTNNERFSYDAFRRFIQLFGKVALGIEDEYFDKHFEMLKRRVNVRDDIDLTTENLQEISERYLDIVEYQSGQLFPEDVYEQLEIAIKAVFNSWTGKRAIDYRHEFHITEKMANGTAVNVVTMVFGNMGNDSATGVGFTRDPGTGENKMYGEYLINAQGEDVVAGIRTPKPVQRMEIEMPDMYKQLVELRNKLEIHYNEVQDYEYTIENGQLYCLQTRNAKMNAVAMVRSSIEMLNEGLITKAQALLRIHPEQLEQLLHPRLDPNFMKPIPLAKGLAASPGAAKGKCVFDADRAESLGRAGEKVILVREETKPEDIHGFFKSQGILTSRGGKTSHAAVVARSMGKACVAGADGIAVNTKKRHAIIGNQVLHEGDFITIDGSSGEVFMGDLPTIDPEFSHELQRLLALAEEVASLKVMANADTPEAAQHALEYGAMGIGLCRTERMFNSVDRLPIVVEMILANTTKSRQTVLDKLLPIQRSDFKKLFKVMSPRPVTIRLLDPPLHEFLPTEMELTDEIKELRQLHGTVKGVTTLMNALRVNERHPNDLPIPLPAPFDQMDEERVNEIIAKKELTLSKVRELQEVNPMLGHRGVRLGITYPEIYAMQIRAILEATAECLKEGIEINPEIMVPQVITAQELKIIKKSVDSIQAEVETKYDVKLKFEFGSMVETVRACFRASELAGVAEFFSFGTNDLTQAAFSFSREDAENKFLPLYNKTEILHDNPFEVLDVKGVGELMRMTVEWGRKTRAGLKVGICGEQGGHPDSIKFCHHIDLDYVSCSAPRVPIAILAAAQAKLLEAEYNID